MRFCQWSIAWALALPGCDRSPPRPEAPVPTEATFVLQLDRVRAGASDRIEVESSSIGDADLALLGDLAGTRHLKLKRADISDAGLAHLAGLTQLETLVLQGEPRVSDAGLAHLSGLSQLRTLNLGRSEVTDEGLAAIRDLTQLRLLRLGSSRITGAGLAHLREMKELRNLILQNAPLTDAAVPHLLALPKLESLYVEGTDITSAGAGELLRAFPKLHLHPHDLGSPSE
jgi:Leucine-rich repeat (LRR) protein